MAYSVAGIKQVTVAKKNTFGDTNLLMTALGLRPSGVLKFSPIDEIVDYRGRKMRNRNNIEALFKTYQPDLRQLKNIITGFIPDLGVDVEILTVNGDVFHGIGQNALGIDFTYKQSAKERSLEYKLQRSYQYEDYKVLIDAMDSNQAENTGITNYGINATSFRKPWLGVIHFGGNEIDLNSIIDYNIELTPDFEVNTDNIPLVNYINGKVEITSRNASITQLVTLLNNNLLSVASSREDTSLSGATHEIISFAAGVLTQTEEIELGDESRFIKLIYEGKFPLSNMTFNFGTAYGDTVDALGQSGGTLSISL